MNVESFLNYERKRKVLINDMKEKIGLNIKEILVLQVLKGMDKNEVSMNILKQRLIAQNVDYLRSVASLAEKEYFQKERSTVDERAIIISETDRERIQKDFSKLEVLLKRHNSI